MDSNDMSINLDNGVAFTNITEPTLNNIAFFCELDATYITSKLSNIHTFKFETATHSLPFSYLVNEDTLREFYNFVLRRDDYKYQQLGWYYELLKEVEDEHWY